MISRTGWLTIQNIKTFLVIFSFQQSAILTPAQQVGHFSESWRTVAYSQLASALLLGLATTIAPESPYWLVERGRWAYYDFLNMS